MRQHPGFPFSLGSDEWESSGFSGAIKGYSSPNRIDWLGSSILKEDGEESQLNINLLMPPTHDAPHLILKVSKSKPSDANQKLTLMMDYIPRRAPYIISLL
jgi:hypothetical protein